MLRSVISKCYQCKSILFQHISNTAGLFFFFFSSRHCFKYLVCIYSLGLQVWSVICLPGEIYDLFNVESQQQMFAHLQYVIPGKTYSSLGLASGPYFIFRKPYCLNPYRAFYVWSFQSLYHLKRTTSPPLCRYLKKKKKHHPFQIPATLSTVHRHIFIFWKEKKETVYDLRRRGETVRLTLHRWGELMVFIQFIFYTLCTLIYKDADIQLTLCFALHWFFRRNIHHTLPHTELPERDITFPELYSFSS